MITDMAAIGAAAQSISHTFQRFQCSSSRYDAGRGAWDRGALRRNLYRIDVYSGVGTNRNDVHCADTRRIRCNDRR